MIVTLGVLTAVIWIPVIFYQINRREFLVLISWLFIAPVVSNLVSNPGSNPFFQISAQRWGPRAIPDSYLDVGSDVTIVELLDPTRVLFAIFLLKFVLELCVRRNRLSPFDKTEIRMGVFAAVVLCSALQSQRVAFGIHTALDAFIIPFVGYLIARRFVTSEVRLHKLVNVLSFMGAYLIVLGVLEYVANRMGYYRLQGPFYSTDLLYVVMVTVFFVVLAERIGNEKYSSILSRLTRKSVIYLGPIIIFLTWSRGNWLGFLLALGVFLFLVRRSIGTARKLTATACVALAGAMLIAILPLVTLEDLFDERISSAGNAYGRLATWEVGLQALSKHPIFGIGLNDSRVFLIEHQAKVSGVTSYDTLHNSLLAIAVELGTVGLVAYLFVLASLVRTGLTLCFRGDAASDRCRGAALVALVVAQQVGPLFSLGLYLPHAAQVYLYVCAGAITGLYRRERFSLSLSSLTYQRGAMPAEMATTTR